jgi:hypothetical protein
MMILVHEKHFSKVINIVATGFFKFIGARLHQMSGPLLDLC